MRKLSFLLTVSGVIAGPSLAQESLPGPAALGTVGTPVIVVAAGTRERLDASGQPVTVISGDEIAAVQGPDIVRVLERAPGVTVSRNGGLGGFTGVRVRGAEAEQLLVLVDGVRLADPAAPGAGFDFGALVPHGIGQIELLRGSNSTIWGSQAIGGVLAVTSAERRGVEGAVEFGARDTLSASLGGGTAWSGGDATFDAGFVETDGFSTAAGGTERDGFRQWQLAGRASHGVAPWLTLESSMRLAHGRLDLDGFPPPAFTFADTDEQQRTRQASGRFFAKAYLASLILDGGFSVADTRREQFDPAIGAEPTYGTHGRSERAELRGRWNLAPPIALRFGAEREWIWFESSFDPRQRAATSAAYAQLGYVQGSLALNAGLRRDQHSDFGGEWSVGADTRLTLWRGWNVHASYGDGFKAPSLFQLFSDFGNAGLEPERSRSFDVGFGNGDRNAARYFDVTLFRRDTRDLIGFVSCFGQTGGLCAGRPSGTYDNIGRARAQGVEVEGGFRPLAGLGISAAYAWIEAVDRTLGSSNERNDLARRPRHALTLTGDWRPIEALFLAADLRIVSGSFDDAANVVRMRGYGVLTVRASWDVSERVALFGRIENLGDERYETAAGYATPGRSGYIGARARW